MTYHTGFNMPQDAFLFICLTIFFLIITYINVREGKYREKSQQFQQDKENEVGADETEDTENEKETQERHCSLPFNPAWSKKVEARTNLYLIDFENTGINGLSGVEKLKKESVVIIFFSSSHPPTRFLNSEAFKMSQATFFFCHLHERIKNGMDFAISTFLGYLVGTYAGKYNYYIVSEDQGYLSTMSFWAENGLNIKLAESVSSSKTTEISLSRQRVLKTIGIYNFFVPSSISKKNVKYKPIENLQL